MEGFQRESPNYPLLDEQEFDLKSQLELHLISTTVTQPGLAAIRYQFWRDALNLIWTGKTADGEQRSIPQHPVAIILDDMKRSRPVQRYYLSQMIDVRVSCS